MRLWLKIKIITMYGSQRNFARICGKSDYWISRIIKGKLDPSERDKRLIISRLGVDYEDDLFVKKENSNIPRVKAD